MSRVERVSRMLRQIEDETRMAFDEHTKLYEENAKLRKFATEAWELLTCNEPVFVWSGLREKARELGIEMNE